MTNIAAALGLAQLEQIETHMAAHREVAGWYRQHLGAAEEFLVLPAEAAWAHHAYWLYTIQLRNSVRLTRDEVMARLAEAGIETRPVFYPMHLMPPYHEPGAKYPVAETLAARGISLPTHGLLSEDDVAFISEQLIALCRG
jgi:perosamine synthetase